MENPSWEQSESKKIGDKNIKASAAVIGGLCAAAVAAVMGFNIASSTLEDWKDWNA